MASVLGMMAARLKWGLLIFALHWHIPAGMAQSGVQIITHDDIARSGITRLSDLFALAGAWSATSIEGYHWNVTPLGVDQPDAWQLFVDSVPVNVRAIDHYRLNLLPISVSEICRVEFHSSPVVIGGMAVLSGAINMYTCDLTDDLTVKVSAAASNETGDPGPWRYTPRAVPNVDRSGPTLQGSVAWVNAKTSVQLQASTDEHHATDPRIRTRVLTLYRGEKAARIQLRNARLEMHRAQHRLTLATTRSRDFLYSMLVGLEAPIVHTLRYLQLSGRRRTLQYYLVARQNDIDTRNSPRDQSTSLKQFTISSQLLASSPRNIPRLSIGLRSRLTQAEFESGASEITLFRGSAFAHWSRPWAPSLESNFFGALRLDSGKPGFTAMVTSTLGEPRLDLTIVFTNRSLAAQQNYPYWLRKGYGPGRTIMFEHDQLRTTLFAADLSWQIDQERVAYSITGGLRRHTGLQQLVVSARFDSVSTGLVSSGQVIGRSGQIGRIAGQVQMQWSEGFRTVMHATWAWPLSGQSEYHSLWKQRLQIQSITDFTPNARFSVQMRIRLRGASHWPDYTDVARDGPDYYTSDLSPAVLADLTIQKRLWRDHLRLSATLLNLIDHNYIHHPAGARSRLTLNVRAAWRMNTIIRRET